MLDFLAIFGAVVPMYVAIGLAFVSVRWWKVFTPEQCSGINKFVSDFAVPFLVLDLLTSNNPYTMNFHVLAADAVQKIVILAALVLWKILSKNGSFEWVITLFSLSTLPNTLLIGLPVIQSMYGDSSAALLIQIVVVQAVIWFNLLLAMYEYRAARILISDQFPTIAGSIASVRVDPDVVSLGDHSEQLEADVEVGANGKLHVVLRTSSASSRISMESTSSVHSANELNSRAGGSFSLQSSKRAGISKSHSTSGRNFLRKGSNSSRVANASFDIDVIVEDSEPSLHQTTSRSSTKNSDEGDEGKKENPPAGVVTRLILVTVWRKLIRNPVTYASVVGLAWSLIAFRVNIKLPLIIKGSITILSKTGVGMAMFSLGLFIAQQPKIMACKLSILVTCAAVRLIVGPAVMAGASAAIGLHKIVFQSSTVQAALPSAIVCFVFSKQYHVHPEIFSTSIITTTIFFLPVTIVCYFLLRLIPW